MPLVFDEEPKFDPAKGGLQFDEPTTPNAAGQTAANIRTQKIAAEANARKQLDVLSKSEPMLGFDAQGNPLDLMPNEQGQFVRKQGASPTDVMNEAEFVTPHKPGYDPKDLGIINPRTGQKEKLPDWAVPFAQRINDFGIGVADTLSSAVAMPVNDIDVMMRDLTGKGIFQNPASAKEQVSKWMTEHGIPNTSQQAFDNWWSDLGAETATQGLLSLAMIAGAGPLAEAGSALESGGAGMATGNAINRIVGGKIASLGKTLGKVGAAGQASPRLIVGGNIGAGVGAHVAPELSNALQSETGQKILGYTPFAEIISDPATLAVLGSLVGGMVGSSFASLGRVRPGLNQRQFGGLPRFGGRQARGIETSGIGENAIIPLTNKTFNPAEISYAVQGYKENVTNMINQSMAVIRNGARDPAQAAGRVVQLMDQAWKKATALRNSLYKPIDVSAEFDPSPIQAKARAVQEKVIGDVAQARFLPKDVIDEILSGDGWVKRTGGEYNLGVKTPISLTARPISIDRARQMMTTIGSKIAELRKISGTQQLISNLVDLSNSISTTMDEAFPQNFALKKANEFSRWMSTKFDMGPTGQFGQVRRDDAALVDSRQAMQTAMRHEKFAPGMAEIGKALGNDPAVRARIDNYLRSTVDDIANQARNPVLPDDIASIQSAEAAHKYMNSPDFKRLAKAWPEISTEMGQQFDDLNTGLKAQREINNSKFFGKAGEEPEKAAENLLNSGTKMRDVAMFNRVLGGNQDAKEALIFAVTRKLGQSVDWDPVAFKNLLHSKDNIAMLKTLMTPERFAGMSRVADAMEEFVQGPEGKRQGIVKSTTKLGGRIIGLIGARLLGAKSIQSHGIGAQVGGSIMADLFNVISPDAMLANALVDPRWERLVMSKVPSNIEDFRRTNKLLGALVGSIHAGHAALTDDEGNIQK